MTALTPSTTCGPPEQEGVGGEFIVERARGDDVRLRCVVSGALRRAGSSVFSAGAAEQRRVLPGDIVRCDAAGVTTVTSRRPFSEQPLLAGVLLLGSSTLYGSSARGAPLFRFEPYDRNFPAARVGAPSLLSRRNVAGIHVLVVVRLIAWESTAALPRGELVEVLGDVGAPGPERAALAVTACPWTYARRSDAALDADITTAIAAADSAAAARSANDATSLLAPAWHVLHIDPPGCEDVDDVIALRPRADGGYDVAIVIADVACAVPTGSALDAAAARIGQTLYDGDGGVLRPMLPPALSTRALSLRPDGRVRPGLALRFTWCAGTGVTSPPTFVPVAVRVHAGFTYDTVLSGADATTLFALREVASTLAGRPLGDDTHAWVEAFMLTVNTAAGAALSGVGDGLLRAHAPPDLARLSAWAPAIAAAGGADIAHLANAAATYVPATDVAAHWGLGVGAYAHASSPLRRYADLVNQRVLSRHSTAIAAPVSLPLLAARLNARAKAVKAFERDAFFVDAVRPDALLRADGIVVEAAEGQHRVWVPAWRRLVKARDGNTASVGASVQVVGYCDLRAPTWKSRILFVLREPESHTESRSG